MYFEYSFIEDLFVYFIEVWRFELEVKEFKQKFQKIYRNDLIESLNIGIVFVVINDKIFIIGFIN